MIPQKKKFMHRACAAAFAVFLSLVSSCSKSDHYPHILIISVDGLRTDYISCYKGRGPETPGIDRLAGEGARFEKAYTPCPLPAPGHASLLVGMPPYAHGLRCQGTHKLDEKLDTLAETLAAKGYETAAVVGSSLLHNQYGIDQGFQDYFDDLSEALPFGCGLLKLKGRDVTLQAKRRLVARFKDKPMFLLVNYADLAGIEPQKYELMLRYLDAQIAELIDAVPSDRPAVVVITSVYPQTFFKGQTMESGYSLDDAAVRVPLIISGPGIQKGKTIQGEVSLIDLAPALLELAGINQARVRPGSGLLQAIQSGRAQDKPVYTESMQPYCSMDWKPVRRFIGCDKDSGPEKAQFEPDPEASLFEKSKDMLSPATGQALEILALLQKADIHAYNNENDSAETALKKALSMDPGNIRALNRMAWIFLESGKITEAKELFIRVLESRKNDPLATTGLAACLFKSGDTEKALDMLAPMENKTPLPLEYYALYGEMLLINGNLETSQAALEKAASLNPLDKKIFLMLGKSLAGRQKYNEALKQLERAITLDNKYLEAYSELLKIHEKTGNMARVEAYRKKVEELSR